jgi:hypothetical protein
LESFGIQVIKNSCNFAAKGDRFDDRQLREKAMMPGPGQYSLENQLP